MFDCFLLGKNLITSAEKRRSSESKEGAAAALGGFQRQRGVLLSQPRHLRDAVGEAEGDMQTTSKAQGLPIGNFTSSENHINSQAFPSSGSKHLRFQSALLNNLCFYIVFFFFQPGDRQSYEFIFGACEIPYLPTPSLNKLRCERARFVV